MRFVDMCLCEDENNFVYMSYGRIAFQKVPCRIMYNVNMTYRYSWYRGIAFQKESCPHAHAASILVHQSVWTCTAQDKYALPRNNFIWEASLLTMHNNAHIFDYEDFWQTPNFAHEPHRSIDRDRPNLCQSWAGL